MIDVQESCHNYTLAGAAEAAGTVTGSDSVQPVTDPVRDCWSVDDCRVEICTILRLNVTTTRRLHCTARGGLTNEDCSPVCHTHPPATTTAPAATAFDFLQANRSQ